MKIKLTCFTLILFIFSCSTTENYNIIGTNVSDSMPVPLIKKYTDNIDWQILTFPAGNIGDEQPLTEPRLKMFKLQASILNDPPFFMQLPFWKSTPQEAVEYVRLAEKVDLKPLAWIIGNEPDLYSSHRRSTEYTKEYSAKRFREFALALKKEFPNIKIAGPALSQPKDDWMKTFIEMNEDITDYLIWHWYPTSGKSSDSNALKTADLAVPMINKYRSWVTNKNIKFGITEYALHWDTNNYHHLQDQTALIWTVETLANFLIAKLDYANYFCLQTYGAHALFGPTNKPTTLYKSIQDFASLQDKNQDIEILEQDSDKSVFRIGGKSGGLLIINKNSEKVINVIKELIFNKEYTVHRYSDYSFEEFPASDYISTPAYCVDILIPAKR